MDSKRKVPNQLIYGGANDFVEECTKYKMMLKIQDSSFNIEAKNFLALIFSKFFWSVLFFNTFYITISRQDF